MDLDGVIFFFAVVLLGQLSSNTIQGTTTSKAPQTIAKKGPTKIAAKTTIPKVEGKIIALRLGNDGTTPQEQCQCILFYQCDRDNTVDLAPNGRSCEENYVCCKIESRPTQVTEKPPISPPPIDTSSVTPEAGNSCRCVPTHLCQRTIEDQTSGIGAIDERKTICDVLEICCAPQYIIGANEPPTLSPLTDSSPECGLRNVQIFNRIVSPEDLKNTSFGEFPWMALLLKTEIAEDGQRTDNVFICGASIISSKVVLTAAHCLEEAKINPNLVKVRVGEYDTHTDATKEPKPHQDKQVIKMTQHPNFNPKTLFNDLALVEVAEPFAFDFHIKPVCVPLSSNTYDYDPNNCVATGWGRNAFGMDSQFPTTLKKVDLTVVPNDRCQQQLRKTRLGQYFVLDSSFTCAGGQSGMDTCEGDGGGPLVCALKNNPNKYVQVGIVSWGIGCGTSLPAVYASLERNLQWLSEEFNTATVFSSVADRKLKA